MGSYFTLKTTTKKMKLFVAALATAQASVVSQPDGRLVPMPPPPMTVSQTVSQSLVTPTQWPLSSTSMQSTSMVPTSSTLLNLLQPRPILSTNLLLVVSISLTIHQPKPSQSLTILPLAVLSPLTRTVTSSSPTSTLVTKLP